MVPSRTSSGQVAPIILRQLSVTLTPEITSTTTCPEAIRFGWGKIFPYPNLDNAGQINSTEIDG